MDGLVEIGSQGEVQPDLDLEAGGGLAFFPDHQGRLAVALGGNHHLARTDNNGVGDLRLGDNHFGDIFGKADQFTLANRENDIAWGRLGERDCR